MHVSRVCVKDATPAIRRLSLSCISEKLARGASTFITISSCFQIVKQSFSRAVIRYTLWTNKQFNAQPS